MKNTQINRERNKVQELAREYKKKGYKVIVEPDRNELPEFMRSMNIRPDLIASSETENLVIEVKTRSNVQSLKDFARIADTIREHEGWDFVFVMTNPKEKTVPEFKAITPTIDEAYKYLNKAKSILNADANTAFVEAALLLAWSGVEAAIRFGLAEVYQKKTNINVASLIRDSVMYGVISSEDGKYLNSLLEIRNKIAHGYPDYDVTSDKVTKLIELVERAIKDIERDELARPE